MPRPGGGSRLQPWPTPPSSQQAAAEVATAAARALAPAKPSATQPNPAKPPSSAATMHQAGGNGADGNTPAATSSGGEDAQPGDAAASFNAAPSAPAAQQRQAPPEIQVESSADSIENSAGSQVEGEAVSVQKAASGGGWGGWGGLGDWASTIQKTAAGVTKDVTELTTSLQAALAEVDDSSTDDEATPAQQQQQRGPAGAPPAAAASARGRPPPGAAAAAAAMQARKGTDSETARKRALERLEAAGSGDENQLRSGVKVRDDLACRIALSRVLNSSCHIVPLAPAPKGSCMQTSFGKLAPPRMDGWALPVCRTDKLDVYRRSTSIWTSLRGASAGCGAALPRCGALPPRISARQWRRACAMSAASTL